MFYQTKLFIDGKYVESSSGQKLAVYNPSDESLITDNMESANKNDVELAVKAAKFALASWKATAGEKRAAIMFKFADLLEANAERLATLESQAMGQPIAYARSVILSSCSLWRYYAGYCDKISGESFRPEEDGIYKIVQYEPLGVCAGICAWNESHYLAAWKMAPAMAAGNTFILKSSEKSPISLAQYGDIISQAGFPSGVINILAGDGVVGSVLASHMEIAAISFTGSSATGKAVQVAAAKSNLKRVTLELGGKSPAIIFDDADLSNAVSNTSKTFLRNSGQICSSTSRVFVQESIAARYIEAIKMAFKEAAENMGDPSREDTLYGPLADMQQFDRVLNFINEARADGTEVLVGGRKGCEKGAFIEPTVLLNPALKSRAFREEIFGPVLNVRTFKTEDEVICLANDTTFGLGSAIYTADMTRALRVANKMEAGLVGINSAFSTSKQTPFGGWKQSGYGRESGSEGLKAYLQTKTIHINMNLSPKL